MRKRNWYMKNSIILFVIIAVSIVGITSVSAKNVCQIIRIEKGKGGGGTRVEIIPEKITVPVDACTVWINFIAREEIRVSFREGAKQCILGTDAASGFHELNIKSGETCYFSDRLPRGKTASLVWKKPGLYKYTIELHDAKGTLSGQEFAGIVTATGVVEVK